MRRALSLFSNMVKNQMKQNKTKQKPFTENPAHPRLQPSAFSVVSLRTVILTIFHGRGFPSGINLFFLSTCFENIVTEDEGLVPSTALPTGEFLGVGLRLG